MNPDQHKVHEAVARLLPVLRRVVAVKGYDDIVPRPRPPATPKDIAAYEEGLGLELPATYRAFLELHDGYDWLLFAGHVLPFRAVRPGGEWFERIKTWKLELAENGVGDGLDGLAIGNLGGENTWVYLDPNEPTGPREWSVVVWDTESVEAFADIPALLDGVRDLCNRILVGI